VKLAVVLVESLEEAGRLRLLEEKGDAHGLAPREEGSAVPRLMAVRHDHDRAGNAALAQLLVQQLHGVLQRSLGLAASLVVVNQPVGGVPLVLVDVLVEDLVQLVLIAGQQALDQVPAGDEDAGAVHEAIYPPGDCPR